MREIEVYTFEQNGEEWGSFKTRDYREAVAYARENQLSIRAHTYEWVDSNVIEDYEPKRRKARR